jgi:uncharacterized protein YjbJ (UPF0337 family)
MYENRVAGTMKNVGGKAQEGLGRMTGDSKMEAEGLMNQVEGTVQDMYGQAKDTAERAAHIVRDRAVEAEDVLRNTIESRPYTAVAVALALGWVLGRMGRPSY